MKIGTLCAGLSFLVFSVEACGGDGSSSGANSQGGKTAGGEFAGGSNAVGGKSTSGGSPSGGATPDGAESGASGADADSSSAGAAGDSDPGGPNAGSPNAGAPNAGGAGAGGAGAGAGGAGAGGAGAGGGGLLTRSGYEFAGEHCTYGGTRTEHGPDTNGNHALDDDEVDASLSTLECATTAGFAQLPALPVVTTVQSFALTASGDDGSARLGFMFTDPIYRQALKDIGVFQDVGGGPYDGANSYVTYKLGNAAWQPYEGRTTPQTYAFSELVVVDNASYYSTNYALFGGLVSVIRNGGKGVYSLTPASATRQAHSIAVPKGSAALYALIAQKGAPGLTFSSVPISSFGSLNNTWTNLATLEADATTVTYPRALSVGGTVVVSYVFGGRAVIRATAAPATVATAADVPIIGECAGATQADISWDGTYLYAACVDASKVLSVKRASVANSSSVDFVTVPTRVQGAVSAVDLAGSSSGLSFGIRQNTALRVYTSLASANPSFDAVMPGDFNVVRAAEGITLVVCDAAGDRVLKTFQSP